MPQPKKDSSVRRRKNKASSAATLKLVEVIDYSSWTLAQLRAEVDERNADLPADDRLPRTGGKAKLAAALAADDEVPIPELPEHPPRFSETEELGEFEIPVAWHEQTREWWRDVWSSPMAQEWDPSDVHNAFVVALLYDDIWTATDAKGRKDALAEYRLQRADLGLSPYSRRRLEWTIEAADDAKAKGDRRRSGTKPPTPGGKPAPDPRLALA